MGELDAETASETGRALKAHGLQESEAEEAPRKYAITLALSCNAAGVL